jgi:hypothetical protein
MNAPTARPMVARVNTIDPMLNSRSCCSFSREERKQHVRHEHDKRRDRHDCGEPEQAQRAFLRADWRLASFHGIWRQISFPSAHAGAIRPPGPREMLVGGT